jgi:hypothetical protein
MTDNTDSTKNNLLNRLFTPIEEGVSPNIPLLIFDLLILPATLMRLLLIYFWGSKYSVKGFRFLDVVLHADRPYFNQDTGRTTIDTIGDDYRVVIRDDSRLYPIDIVENAHLLKVERVSSNNDLDVEQVEIESNTTNNKPRNRTIWASTEVRDNRSDDVSDDLNELNIDQDDQDSQNERDDTDSNSDIESDVVDKLLDIDTDGNIMIDDTEERDEIKKARDNHSINVMEEVSRAIQNIDSRIDLADDDNSDSDSEIEAEVLDTMTETNNDISDSDSLDSDESEYDKDDDVDPIEALLQRARERNRKRGPGPKTGSTNVIKKKERKEDTSIFTDDTTEESVTVAPTNETSDINVNSILDNLESAFEP